MKLAGFNFTKISVEKKTSKLEGLKIGTSINIESIEKVKANINAKDSFLNIKWIYNIEYTPNIANLSFGGNLIISLEKEEANTILKNWEDKKVDPEFNTILINIIMKKANIKALQFEDEFNLPTHFKMPSVKVGKKE